MLDRIHKQLKEGEYAGIKPKTIKKNSERNFTVENHPQAGIRSDAEAGFASCMLLAT